MMTLWISLAGGFGALTRFVADGMIRSLLGRNFPWATLLINVTGSLFLGALTGLALGHHSLLNDKIIFGTGYCGGFTTFSTASFETARLLEEGRRKAAFLQAFGNLLPAFVFALVGLWLTS